MRYENKVCLRCGVVVRNLRRHKERKRCEAVFSRRAGRTR